MGADLILAFAKIPIVSSEDGQERIWTQEEWDAFIDAFTDTQLYDTFTSATGISPQDNPEITPRSRSAWPRDELREHLKTMLKDAFTDVNSYCRDILEFVDSAGIAWFVGGGTSWGDLPAGYETVALIEMAQSYGKKGNDNDH